MTSRVAFRGRLTPVSQLVHCDNPDMQPAARDPTDSIQVSLEPPCIVTDLFTFFIDMDRKLINISLIDRKYKVTCAESA